jgi:hypothetical protein
MGVGGGAGFLAAVLCVAVYRYCYGRGGGGLVSLQLCCVLLCVCNVM